MPTTTYTPASPAFSQPPKDPNRLSEWITQFLVTLQATLLRIRRQINIPDTLQTRRVHSHNATDLVAGDAVLSGGWGDTPVPTAVFSGSDQRASLSFTSGSLGLTANPTITLTFSEGAWPVAPFALVLRNDNNSPTPALTWTTTTTTLVITFNGTPAASTAYAFEWHVWG